MKRWGIYAMMLLSLCALCACGQGAKTEEGFSQELVTQLVEQGAFSEELEALDEDTTFLLYRFADYGVEREDLVSSSVIRSTGATCEEAAVLLWKDNETAGKALEAINDYVEDRTIENEQYRPNEMPKLHNARIGIKGNTLLLVVANDSMIVSEVLQK